MRLRNKLVALSFQTKLDRDLSYLAFLRFGGFFGDQFQESERLRSFVQRKRDVDVGDHLFESPIEPICDYFCYR